MTTTPFLGITHLATGDANQPEVPLNEALDEIDEAINDYVSVDIDGAPLTLTLASHTRHSRVRLYSALEGSSGAISAAFAVDVPDGERVIEIFNDTDYVCTIDTTTGSTHTIPVYPRTTKSIRVTRGGGSIAKELQRLWSSEIILPFVFLGAPTAGALVAGMVMREEIVFPKLMNGSAGRAGTVAADSGSHQFNFKKNGGSAFATADFAFGSSTPTFTNAAAVAFAIGDRLEIIAPYPADSALADIFLSIVCGHKQRS